jgi:hypothetical protein
MFILGACNMETKQRYNSHYKVLLSHVSPLTSRKLTLPISHPHPHPSLPTRCSVPVVLCGPLERTRVLAYVIGGAKVRVSPLLAGLLGIRPQTKHQRPGKVTKGHGRQIDEREKPGSHALGPLSWLLFFLGPNDASCAVRVHEGSSLLEHSTLSGTAALFVVTISPTHSSRFRKFGNTVGPPLPPS